MGSVRKHGSARQTWRFTTVDTVTGCLDAAADIEKAHSDANFQLSVADSENRILPNNISLSS